MHHGVGRLVLSGNRHVPVIDRQVPVLSQAWLWVRRPGLAAPRPAVRITVAVWLVDVEAHRCVLALERRNMTGCGQAVKEEADRVGTGRSCSHGQVLFDQRQRQTADRANFSIPFRRARETMEAAGSLAGFQSARPFRRYWS